jgi:hypothetical protein
VLIVGDAAFTSTPLPIDLSGYYYTPMRNILEGTLCVLGVFLVVYDVGVVADRWITNVAGVGGYVAGASDPDRRIGTSDTHGSLSGSGSILHRSSVAGPRVAGPAGGCARRATEAEKAGGTAALSKNQKFGPTSVTLMGT